MNNSSSTQLQHQSVKQERKEHQGNILVAIFLTILKVECWIGLDYGEIGSLLQYRINLCEFLQSFNRAWQWHIADAQAILIPEYSSLREHLIGSKETIMCDLS